MYLHKLTPHNFYTGLRYLVILNFSFQGLRSLVKGERMVRSRLTVSKVIY